MRPSPPHWHRVHQNLLESVGLGQGAEEVKQDTPNAGWGSKKVPQAGEARFLGALGTGGKLYVWGSPGCSEHRLWGCSASTEGQVQRGKVGSGIHQACLGAIAFWSFIYYCCFCCYFSTGTFKGPVEAPRQAALI